MKHYLIIILIGLTMFAWLASQANTEDSWLDKGINIFKNVQEPSSAEIAEAFKQALSIGTENVVSQLGATDGFNADSAIHIPLPEELNTAKEMLSKIGKSQLLDDLELKLNRAAEAATPKAKDLFLEAITDMTFEDIKDIYEGPEDSATKYFQSKMSPALKKEMEPIVEKMLSEAGAIQAYDRVIGEYQELPFVPDVKADLTEHVLQKGLDGIFHYIAEEEAGIRTNPAKQITTLLKKVFGGK